MASVGERITDAQEESFDVESGVRKRLRETDPHRLSQRQKAIDKGKNTRSYQLFLQKVPRHLRGDPGSQHARTPDKYEVCSAKAWLGKVRKWRLHLHEYDSEPDDGEEVIQVPSLTRQGIKPAPLQEQPCSNKKRPRNDQEEVGAAQVCHFQPADGLGKGDSADVLPEAAVQPERQGTLGTGLAHKSIYDDWDEEGEDIAL